jgi:hypothetical protein
MSVMSAVIVKGCRLEVDSRAEPAQPHSDLH